MFANSQSRHGLGAGTGVSTGGTFGDLAGEFGDLLRDVGADLTDPEDDYGLQDEDDAIQQRWADGDEDGLGLAARYAAEGEDDDEDDRAQFAPDDEEYYDDDFGIAARFAAEERDEPYNPYGAGRDPYGSYDYGYGQQGELDEEVEDVEEDDLGGRIRDSRGDIKVEEKREEQGEGQTEDEDDFGDDDFEEEEEEEGDYDNDNDFEDGEEGKESDTRAAVVTYPPRSLDVLDRHAVTRVRQLFKAMLNKWDHRLTLDDVMAVFKALAISEVPRLDQLKADLGRCALCFC